MSYQLARHLFTVHEYERMGETGILREDDRVELIEGEITEMAAVGKRHASCVNYLNRVINRALGDAVIVSVQNPLQLSDLSAPEPDIAALRPRDDFYRHQTPRAADVLLVIEVSDSSLEYDRRTKLPAYALAGIPEFWIVNLVEERIEVYTLPVGGKYTRVARITQTEELTSTNIPDLTLNAAALLA